MLPGRPHDAFHQLRSHSYHSTPVNVPPPPMSRRSSDGVHQPATTAHHQWTGHPLSLLPPVTGSDAISGQEPWHHGAVVAGSGPAPHPPADGAAAGQAGGGAQRVGRPRRLHGDPDPRLWTVQQFRNKSEPLLDWLRAFAEKGALEIELKLQVPYIMSALQRAYLPVNSPMLSAMAPDMIPLAGCSAKHYLITFEMWESWAVENKLPVFPIFGAVVVLCVLDRARSFGSPADLARHVAILELYREATTPCFQTLSECPRSSFGLSQEWMDSAWEAWDAFIVQAGYKLSEWRAIIELISSSSALHAWRETVVLQTFALPAHVDGPHWQSQPPLQITSALDSPRFSSSDAFHHHASARNLERHHGPTVGRTPAMVSNHQMHSMQHSSQDVRMIAPQPPICPAVLPTQQAQRPSSDAGALLPTLSSGVVPNPSPYSTAVLAPTPVTNGASTPSRPSASTPSTGQTPAVVTVTAARAMTDKGSKSSMVSDVRQTRPSLARSHSTLASTQPVAAPTALPLQPPTAPRRLTPEAAASDYRRQSQLSADEISASRQEQAGVSGAAMQQDALARVEEEREKADIALVAGKDTMQRASGGDAIGEIPEGRRDSAAAQGSPSANLSMTAGLPSLAAPAQALLPDARPSPNNPTQPVASTSADAVPPQGPVRTQAQPRVSQPQISPASVASISTMTIDSRHAGRPADLSSTKEMKREADQPLALATKQQRGAALEQYPPRQQLGTGPRARQRAPKLRGEEAEEAEFWAVAQKAEEAVMDCARAQTAASLAARAKAALEADARAPMRDTAKALETLRASPWTGKKAPPPSPVKMSLEVPFGDYVPEGSPVPMLTSLSTSLSIRQDPLNILKPLPSAFPPPPPVSVVTATPFAFSAESIGTMCLTPEPFFPYPAALGPFNKNERDKAWSYARDVTAHVDSELAKRVAQQEERSGAPASLLAGDECERERQNVLASLLRKHLLHSLMGTLPDVAEPDAAKSMRKRIKKLKRRAQKAERKAAKAAAQQTEVLDLADSDDEAGETAPMGVDGAAAPPAAPQASTEHSQVQAEEVKPQADVVVSSTPAQSQPAVAMLSDPEATDRTPSITAPPAPTVAPPSESTPPALISLPSDASTSVPGASTSATFPPRPSLTGTISAPVMPGARSRSNSQGVMRRRPSVSGAGVHPLAQLYAHAPSAMRQMLRGKANELRGVPNDPVALAVATARLTSPALRSEAALASSARGSPRMSDGAVSLAVPSPPLVPIPLPPAGGASEGKGLGRRTGNDRRKSIVSARPDELGIQKVRSALGMSIESPAMSTVAHESPSSGEALSRPTSLGPREEAPSVSTQNDSSGADASGPAPGGQQALDASGIGHVETSAPDSSITAEVPPYARIRAGAGGAPTDASRKGQDAAASDPITSTTMPRNFAQVSAPDAPVVNVADSKSDSTASLALKAPGEATARKSSPPCQSCTSATCPGARLPTLCTQRRRTASAATEVTAARNPYNGSPVPSMSSKRRIDDEVEADAATCQLRRSQHPLRHIRRDWLAVSEPPRPFSVPVKRVRVLPPTAAP